MTSIQFPKTGLWKIFLALSALILPILILCSKVRNSQQECEIVFQRFTDSGQVAFYQFASDDSYSESRRCDGYWIGGDRCIFRIPREAAIEKIRFDFADKPTQYVIAGMSFTHHLFLKASLSPTQILSVFMPNPSVSWRISDDSLLISTAASDPFIVSRPELLKPMLEYHLDFSRILLFVQYYAVWFFLVLFFLFRTKILTFYQQVLLPKRWFLALAVFVFCFLISLPERFGFDGVTISRTSVLLFLIFFFMVIAGFEKFQQKRCRNEIAGQPKKSKRVMDMSMVYFRAFAILCIVSGHYLTTVLWIPGGMPPLFYAFLCALFGNDTIFFLFISGYLFYYLTDHYTVQWEGWKCHKIQGKFDLLTFYRKKLTNVACPYIVISLLCALYFTWTPFTSGLVGEVFHWSEFGTRLLFGLMQMQFWYIPFILIVFLLAPLLLLLPHKCVPFLMFCIPVFLVAYPRPQEMVSVDGLACFVPAFLGGIWYAMDKERLLAFFKRFLWCFLIGSCFCLLQYFRFNADGIEYYGAGWNAVVLSAHKLLLVPVVIVILSKIEGQKIPELIAIANLSFTMYFLHIIIVQGFFSSISDNLWLLGCSSAFVLILIRSGLTFLYLLVFSWSLKILCGKYSRMLVGA